MHEVKVKLEDDVYDFMVEKYRKSHVWYEASKIVNTNIRRIMKIIETKNAGKK